MLYNPNWKQKTKVDPLSLEGLIAWLETKPRDGTYDYGNSLDCLLCQYLRETLQASEITVSFRYWRVRHSDGSLSGCHELPPYFNEVALLGRRGSGRHTYGQALNEALKYLDRRNRLYPNT